MLVGTLYQANGKVYNKFVIIMGKKVPIIFFYIKLIITEQ